MSHSHEHSHNHSHSHDHSHAGENIKTAFFLNFFFVIVEIIGGVFTNSFAILSDAVHDFGDCLAIGCAYFLEKVSLKKSNEKYTYGYRRYSLVSAIITSVILIIGSAGVIYGSVARIKEPKEIYGLGMLIIAVFGFIINGLAVLKTHKGTGANEKAISLHLLEDVLGWAAVLAGSIFIYFFNWTFIDTLLSLVIAVFLLVESIKQLVSVFHILLETTPKDFDIEEYKNTLLQTENVTDIHHIHIWSMDGEDILATLHANISAKTLDDLKTVKKQLEEKSREYGVHHLTVQLDLESECNSCQCDY
ncbi:MAG: cation diffusion facilitator family transporter [Acutalibacteraceae bacterium]